jgi:predicted transcriptional regulator
MLGKLFGSAARVKILKQFLLNPDKRYYIRQLSRDLGLQVNSVRRELENMVDFGLLTSSNGKEPENGEQKEIEEIKNLKAGKVVSRKEETEEAASGQEKKYYRVNQNFLLFEELKALIVKSQMLHEQDLLDSLKKLGNIKLLVLTGFFTSAKDAPVDILIVGNVGKEKVNKIIKELEKEMNKEINYSLMDYNEFKYRRDMTDVFLFHVLEGKKMVVLDEIGI